MTAQCWSAASSRVFTARPVMSRSLSALFCATVNSRGSRANGDCCEDSRERWNKLTSWFEINSSEKLRFFLLGGMNCDRFIYWAVTLAEMVTAATSCAWQEGYITKFTKSYNLQRPTNTEADALTTRPRTVQLLVRPTREWRGYVHARLTMSCKLYVLVKFIQRYTKKYKLF